METWGFQQETPWKPLETWGCQDGNYVETTGNLVLPDRKPLGNQGLPEWKPHGNSNGNSMETWCFLNGNLLKYGGFHEWKLFKAVIVGSLLSEYEYDWTLLEPLSTVQQVMTSIIVALATSNLCVTSSIGLHTLSHTWQKYRYIHLSNIHHEAKFFWIFDTSCRLLVNW